RSASRHPLFQVMLVLQNAPQARLHLPGINMIQIAVPIQQVQFDLALTLSERFDPAGKAAGIAGTLEYSVDLFDRETALQLATGFERVLQQAAANPQTPVRELEVTGGRQASGKGHAGELSPGVVASSNGSTASSSGKLGGRTKRRESKRLPRTPLEELFCRLFAELLSLEQVGANENFFHLGGDSILSIQLVSRARKAGLVLAPRDIFQHQTPEALALSAGREIPNIVTPVSIEE